MVVRPIVTYAATVWWPRVKLRTSRAELGKLQRMACLGITGALKTAPIAIIEVILGLKQCTCSWRLRSEQIFIYSTAAINKNSNLNILDTYT